MNQNNIISVIGGTGFLGRYVVSALAEAGYRVNILSRHPERAFDLKPAGDVGQITAQYADITKPETLKPALSGSYGVINLVGLLFEQGSQNFASTHVKGAEDAAKFAYSAGAQRYIHLSALGIERSSETSSYAKTKLEGERAVKEYFSDATILRPSVVFGPEDNFYNQFAKMAAFPLAPGLPLIRGGKTHFQPVYVVDVADAVLACLASDDTAGQTYELAGPDVLSFKEILQNILEYTHRKKPLIPVPLPSLAARVIHTACTLPFTPDPLLTADQVRLLAYDNVAGGTLPGLEALGIHATSPASVVPNYLAIYRS